MLAPFTRLRFHPKRYCFHLHITFVSFSAVYSKTIKTIENGNKLLLACQGNLNNLQSLLHRFQKFTFSVKTIHLYNKDIIMWVSL